MNSIRNYARRMVSPGLFLGLMITVLIVIIYAQVWHHEFLAYDDDRFITENWNIHEGLNWQSIKWAFTNNHAALWFPVLWLSHILDIQFFGLHSGWHHLHNLGLHWLNSILLLVVLHRLTGRIWRSGIVALLFAVHPQHVESVAWVTERKDTLSTVFFLATILFYHRYTLRRTTGRYGLTLGSLILGLATKPMLVTLPMILLLLDYWPLGRLQGTGWGKGDRTWIELVSEKASLLVAVLVMGVLTYCVGKVGGIVLDEDIIPFRHRLLNGVSSYYEYLRQFVWPDRLYAQYGFRIPMPWNRLALSLGVVTAISVFAVRLRRSHPYVLTGWLWYLGILVPVLGLVQQGLHAMADRYTYFCLTGIFFIVVWGLADLTRRFKVAPRVVTALTLCILLGLTWTARTQAGYWRDTETLFRRTVEMDPNNVFGLNKLGDYYRNRGRLQEARIMYDRAIAADPRSPHAYINMAVMLEGSGEVRGALDLYRRSIAANGNAATVHYNLGALLQRLGRYEKAVTSYLGALALRPDHRDSRNNLGLSYLALSRYAEAATELMVLMTAEPENALVRYNLARVASRAGQTREARERLEQAVALGFDNWKLVAEDPDLAALRSTPGFDAFMASQRSRGE